MTVPGKDAPQNPGRYRLFHPDHEVRQFFLLSMRNAIRSIRSESAELFDELFARAGLLDKQPLDWVPAQPMLDICNEMVARGGAQQDFRATGWQIAMDAVFPPDFDDLPLARKLASIGETYPSYNRGTDIGYSRCETIDSQHLVFHVKTPWPAEMNIGLFSALCKRFLPPECSFEVYFDETHPNSEQGGEESLVHVKWG